jgi:hypothetical protein
MMKSFFRLLAHPLLSDLPDPHDVLDCPLCRLEGGLGIPEGPRRLRQLLLGEHSLIDDLPTPLFEFIDNTPRFRKRVADVEDTGDEAGNRPAQGEIQSIKVVGWIHPVEELEGS